MTSQAQNVTSQAQNAAQGVSTFAKRAKTPLIAGGATLAGLAGGALLRARIGRRHKVLGIPMPKRNGFKFDAKKISSAVTDAAKRADQLGQSVSKTASSVQQVSETANHVAKKS
jgi:methyl-accepting chemotaxis protein